MDVTELGPHISRRFNEDLEGVRTRVLQMGGFVEQQLQKAISALVDGDSELGEEVARGDHAVNNMEVAIDEECSRILATRAPAASDLRLIVAIIKTITDLERIGDEAEKIGYIASRLAILSASLSRALAPFVLPSAVALDLRVPHLARRLVGSAGRSLLHFVRVFLILELDEVGYVKKRIALQAEVDKCRLHAGQDARDASVVNGTRKGVLVFAFVVNFRELIVFKNCKPRLMRRA